MGLPTLSISNSRQGSMHLLEPMSAEPIASLCESADQPLPSSSASPQCTSRLNFEESQIAVVMLMMPGSSGKGRWQSHPLFVCFQTDCLSVAKRLVSVARLGDGGANPLFVCCYLSNWSRKGRWITVPIVCDCLGLAMVCCMSRTPIPITVSTPC